jgi:CRP/FNR family cyclic AMP-dependent transcriptional regulator
MAHVLNKLFHIRPNEWPRFLLIYVILFLIVTGSAWGKTIVEAAFLDLVGVQFLPWVFVVNGIASIVAIAVYTAFADRISNDKLMVAILAISTAAIVVGIVALERDLVALAYPLLYLVYYVILVDVFNLHRATYVNSFYDTQAAKRVVPVVTSSVQIASIVAGLSMPLLNHYLGSPRNIIIVWAAMLTIAASVIWVMPRILREENRMAVASPDYFTPRAGTTASKSHLSHLDNIREGYHYVSQSSFLRWMALSTLLIMTLFALLNYEASRIIRDTFQTTQNISNFTGLLTGVANLVMLPVQLFLLSRIIGRIGLGNANFIFPTMTLAISGGLVFWPHYITAALAYLDRTTFRLTFHLTIDSLLYNAIPLRVKGRTRAFIGGFLTPIGSLLGGGLLLIPLVSTTWVLGVLIAVLAVAYLATAPFVRKRYTEALIAMLEQEDFSFLLSSEIPDLQATDPATLSQLRMKLQESTSPELTIFLAKLISQAAGPEAVSILGDVAKTAPDSRIRASVIDVLVAAEAQNEAARQLYTDCLADPDEHVRQAAIAGLEQSVHLGSKEFLELALPLLSDPDHEVRASVLPALLQSADPAHQAAAVQALDQFLNSETPADRARGVRVLHQAGGLRFLDKLVKYLADPADEVRLEAMLSVEALTQERLPLSEAGLILDAVSSLQQDPIERVRQAALVVLRRIGARDSHPALVTALTDASPQVRATAVDMLVQLGKVAIPLVHPQLDAPDSQQRKMAVVILSRINRREFGPLVESYITGNLLTIYRNLGRLAALTPCAEHASISVLQSALREQNQQMITEIFYLLTAVHPEETIKTVAESLQSSTARTRANAAEALEALTTPQTARLLAPLLEPDPDINQLLQTSVEAWDLPHPDTITVINQLLTTPDDPWLRAMMTLALGEMGAAASANGSARSTKSTDVLNDLIETAKDDQPSRPEVKKRRTRLVNPLDALMAASESVSLPHQQTTEPAPATTSSGQVPLTLPEIQALLDTAFTDSFIDVRLAARAAKQMITGKYIANVVQEEGVLLSTIEKIIFLKEVPFFRGMTVDQLKVLANVCEEELFEEDARIFNAGDAGGALYVIVSGRVGIEQEKRKGSFARLATIEAHSYFGEMNLFDNSPRSATAIALQDTLTLRLRREPLIALARQYPDLSLELINVLSQRLREANDRVAELTRTRPRELHKLFDTFD